MLKQPDAERRTAAGAGIKWDEENLEDNERIKAGLSSVRINEPKTPYHGPLDAEDPAHMDEDGLAPLHLDPEHSSGSLPSYANGNGHMSQPPASEVASSAGNGAIASHGQATSNDSADFRLEEGSYPASNDNHTVHRMDELSVETEAEEDAKKRNFEAMRRSHYNMKTALVQGRRLSGSGREMGGGDEEDEVDLHEQNGLHGM